MAIFRRFSTLWGRIKFIFGQLDIFGISFIWLANQTPIEFDYAMLFQVNEQQKYLEILQLFVQYTDKTLLLFVDKNMKIL